MSRNHCQGIDCVVCGEPEPCKFREMNRREENLMNKSELIKRIKETIHASDHSIENLPKTFPDITEEAVERDKQVKKWFELFLEWVEQIDEGKNFITIGNTIINKDNICFIDKIKDFANVYFNNANKCLQVDYNELKSKLGL